jgi:hypothetical protein
MIRLVREIVYDPIPTPAGRSGRVAVFAGFAGWALLAVAGTLWITSMTLGLDESGLATSLRVASTASPTAACGRSPSASP